MSQITFNNSASIIDKFFTPISKINNLAVATINEDKSLSSICKTDDNNVILYCKTQDIDTDSGVFGINIPDINRLIKVLNCVNQPIISLNLERNNLNYKSSAVKFKYHLLEDGIISLPRLNISKIENFEFDVTFTINYTNYSNLLKSSAFTINSNKLYISTNENKVICELTDKAHCNTDSFTAVLAESFSGEELATPISFPFDVFKLLSIEKGKNIEAKLNSEKGILMFDISDDLYKLKYITTALVC